MRTLTLVCTIALTVPLGCKAARTTAPDEAANPDGDAEGAEDAEPTKPAKTTGVDPLVELERLEGELRAITAAQSDGESGSDKDVEPASDPEVEEAPAPAGSPVSPNCAALCELAEAICELEAMICELADEHGEPRYKDACARAGDDCTQASGACTACAG